MSRFLACITDLDETTVADRCYSFIQDKGVLPTDDEAFELIKNSKDISDASRKINRMFLAALRDTLLNPINTMNQERFSELLIIDTAVGITDYSIQFNDYTVNNPDQTELEKLLEHMLHLDKILCTDFIRTPLMFSIDVEAHVIQEIINNIEEGIFDRTVDGSCGTTLNIIIDLGFISDIATSNTNFEEDLAVIWDVLITYKPSLSEVRKFEPQFIELLACIENQQ